jgi:hypothetical protein
MKAIEFQTLVNNGEIKIPKQYDINNETVKVIVLYDGARSLKNYDKNNLISAFSHAKEMEPFKKIEDSILWQKESRNEWE